MSTLDKDFSDQMAERLRTLADDYADKKLQAKIEQLLKRESNIGIEANVHGVLRKIAAIAAKENNQDLWQQVHAMLSEVAKVDHGIAERLKDLNIMHADENVRKAAQNQLLAILRDKASADSLAKQFAALPKSTQDMFKSMVEPWLKSTGEGAKTILDQAAMQPPGFFGKQLVELLFLLVKICIGINNPENLKRLEEYFPSSSPEGEKGAKQYIPMPGLK